MDFRLAFLASVNGMTSIAAAKHEHSRILYHLFISTQSVSGQVLVLEYHLLQQEFSSYYAESIMNGAFSFFNHKFVRTSTTIITILPGLVQPLILNSFPESFKLTSSASSAELSMSAVNWSI